MGYLITMPMGYAITTLEIEVARITEAMRVARTTVVPDLDQGHYPDFTVLRRNLSSLEQAIELLKKSDEAYLEELKKTPEYEDSTIITEF